MGVERIGLRFFAGLLACAGATGCVQARTEVVVGVLTDLPADPALPDRLATVAMSVKRDEREVSLVA
ncbi:MAG: hypothetical protein EXR72_08885 [Myxococcales bacterium]|nr:hypothetical protein [Myxococcales bacterium]